MPGEYIWGARSQLLTYTPTVLPAWGLLLWLRGLSTPSITGAWERWELCGVACAPTSPAAAVATASGRSRGGVHIWGGVQQTLWESEDPGGMWTVVVMPPDEWQEYLRLSLCDWTYVNNWRTFFLCNTPIAVMLSVAVKNLLCLLVNVQCWFCFSHIMMYQSLTLIANKLLFAFPRGGVTLKVPVTTPWFAVNDPSRC